jgi:1-acyl-sn-glycerol-3-phosphate acyltransferase
MIKAKHHRVIYPFFKNYGAWKIKKHFNDVFIIGEYVEKNKPLLIISNHMSWWDGFWLNFLNSKLFKRRFYFMMLEEQLNKHWYFKYTGGFPVKKGSRSIIQTLDYIAELLSDHRNMVFIFPQGEIQSLYTRHFKFEKGTEFILKKTENIQAIFVATLIDYFSNPKPSLFMYLMEYDSKHAEIHQIESAYNLFFQQCIEENTNLKSI